MANRLVALTPAVFLLKPSNRLDAEGFFLSGQLFLELFHLNGRITH